MWFTRISLRNPVFATMMMLAFVVLGLFAYQRLKVDQFPNIDLPVVVIITDYPGAAPEVIESEVSKKIEEAVNSVAGISSLSSTNVLGRSTVVIEFELSVNGRKAADDVRLFLDGLSDAPVRLLETAMQQAADALAFEKAGVPFFRLLTLDQVRKA